MTKTAITDPNHREAHEVLTAAVAAAGDEVLSKWEEGFAEDCLKSLNQHGDAWDLTTPRAEKIEQIKGKLKKEGLI